MGTLQWRTDIETTAPDEHPAGVLLHIETTIGPFKTYERALQVARILTAKLKKVTT